MGNFSKIANNLIGQPMFEIMDKARKINDPDKYIIHFEIGDPDFNSPECVIESARQALLDNMTHYTNSKGWIGLREEIMYYTERRNNFKPSINQILVCPANAVIDFIIRCVSNPGEEIIYPDPGFSTYISVIKYNGMIGVPIELKKEFNFKIKSKDVKEKITNKTKLIIINNPSNPTGSIMDDKDLFEIGQIAKENNIYILSDEVYRQIIYNNRYSYYSPSLIDHCKERTIILNSFSKAYSMSGWRLGYAIGPEDLIEKMALLFQTIFSCLPPFIQIAGRVALLGCQDLISKRNNILLERRDVLINGLNKIKNISCDIPEGAFYAFPNIEKTGLSSIEYSDKLLNEVGVCVLPGDYFGEYGKGHVRLSYGSVSIDKIHESLKRIEEFHLKNFGE